MKSKLTNSVLKKEKSTSKNKWLPLLIILIAAILITGAYLWHKQKSTPAIPPNDLAANAIDKLLNAESLRYRTDSLLNVNDQQICYGTIEGEKANNNTYHAWGNILGTEVNIYQINETTYQLDEITHQWVKIPDNTMGKEAMLIAELDPCSNFHFSSLGTAKYLEDETLDNTKCYKLSLNPTLSDDWIEKYFTDIAYTLWIDKKTGYIIKSVITANTENNGTTGTLEITSKFSNYGDTFTIETPIQDQTKTDKP